MLASRQATRFRRRGAWLAVAAAAALGIVGVPGAGAGDVGGSLSRPSSASRFGAAVDVYDQTVVVGAPGIGNGAQAGQAFVYVRNGGQFDRVAALVPSDSASKDGFGTSVAVFDDTVVIGSANAQGTPSAAYVFVRPAGGWTGTVNEAARLQPSVSSAPSRFGVAVDVRGTPRRVAVGDGNAVFVYVQPAAGWSGTTTESARLVAFTGIGHGAGNPGGSVALGDGVVVSGNPFNASHASVRVYVEPAAGWSGVRTEDARLDGVLPSGFGALAVSGGTVAVGSFNQPIDGHIAQGAAYVYEKPAGGWTGDLTPSATLLASDGTSFDEFGSSVAADGDVLVVGAPSPATDGSQNDGAYRFDKPAGGWAGTLTESAQLQALSSFEFGSAVATHLGTTVVGDLLNGAPSNFSGSAFAYLPDADGDHVPDVSDNCPSTPNADQANADGDAQGDACDADDDDDSVGDGLDNCPSVANADQANTDGDAQGDACDADDDNDSVGDGLDNCPTVANADQANTDGDAQGDACDADDDDDSVGDAADNCAAVPNVGQHDLDGDGAGDVCDGANAVRLDILPGVEPNSLRQAGKLVPVAILGRPFFDAPARVDTAALRFGPTGSEAPAVGCSSRDVNGDSLPDLVCDFEMKKTDFGSKDTVGVLTGQTKALESSLFRGTDSVRLSGPPH